MAIGVGLLGTGWMARRSYISAETLTPSLLVVGVGVVEYLQAAHLTPAHFLSFAFSLWLPGLGLLVLGLVSLATSGRTEKQSVNSQAARKLIASSLSGAQRKIPHDGNSQSSRRGT
jgi:hypothetical protein